MTQLNFDRIHRYIHEHGFTIVRTFTRDGKCYLLEVIADDSIQSMYILIPLDKYEIPTEYEAYELEPYNLGDESQIPTALLESTYSDINSLVQLSTEGKGKISIEDCLNAKYKRNVILRDNENAESKLIQSISQQLERLRYSMRGLQYSIAISADKFIALLEDENISLFKCENLKDTKERYLYIVVNLELFYDKVEIIEDDCIKISNSIESILKENQKRNMQSLQQIIQTKNHNKEQVNFLRECSEKYDKYLTEYLPLVSELNKTRKSKETQLDNLRTTVSVNIHHDMKKTHQRQMIERDLEQMKKVGDKLTSTIDTIRKKKQNLLLRIDTIIFNNIVLMDQLFRNMDELKRLETQL